MNRLWLNKDNLVRVLSLIILVVIVYFGVGSAEDSYVVNVDFKDKEEGKLVSKMVEESIEVQNSGDLYLGEDYEAYLEKYLRSSTARNRGKEEYVTANIRHKIPEYYDCKYELESTNKTLKTLETDREEILDKIVKYGFIEEGDIVVEEGVNETVREELGKLHEELKKLDKEIEEKEEVALELVEELSYAERKRERLMEYLGIEYDLEVEDPDITYKRSVIRLITLRNFKNSGSYEFLTTFGYSEQEIKELQEYLGGHITLDEYIELEALILSYMTERNVYMSKGELNFDLRSEVDRDIIVNDIKTKWGVDGVEEVEESL